MDCIRKSRERERETDDEETQLSHHFRIQKLLIMFNSLLRLILSPYSAFFGQRNDGPLLRSINRGRRATQVPPYPLGYAKHSVIRTR